MTFSKFKRMGTLFQPLTKTLNRHETLIIKCFDLIKLRDEKFGLLNNMFNGSKDNVVYTFCHSQFARIRPVHLNGGLIHLQKFIKALNAIIICHWPLSLVLEKINIVAN
jgi:hypothetical protein